MFRFFFSSLLFSFLALFCSYTRELYVHLKINHLCLIKPTEENILLQNFFGNYFIKVSIPHISQKKPCTFSFSTQKNELRSGLDSLVFSKHFLISGYCLFGVSLISQLVKNLPVMQETQVQSLGRGDPLEKEMETHSSILAWRIPQQRSLAGYSPQGCKSQTRLSN